MYLLLFIYQQYQIDISCSCSFNGNKTVKARLSCQRRVCLCEWVGGWVGVCVYVCTGEMSVPYMGLHRHLTMATSTFLFLGTSLADLWHDGSFIFISPGCQSRSYYGNN